jgi:hypothetical protein
MTKTKAPNPNSQIPISNFQFPTLFAASWCLVLGHPPERPEPFGRAGWCFYTCRMQKTCRQCSAPFTITDSDLAFYDKVSPVFNGKKEPIPPPTLCPECRMQRRLGWRNERSLYRRTCDHSKKSIITQYHPDAPWTVYDKSIWHSDAWDPFAFGREIDWGQSMLQQWNALLHVVPRMAIVQQGTMENAEFCNRASNNKNCYLIFSANFNEDCAYGMSLNDRPRLHRLPQRATERTLL